MSEIWMFINQLQLIVLIPLCNIPMPANAKILFTLLMQAAAFDYYDTDDIYKQLLKVEETPARSTNFSLSGFESMWFIINLGTLAAIIVLFPLSYFAREFLELVFGNISCCRRVAKSMKQDLYWNAPLRMIIESYLSMSISCFINHLYLKW